MVSIFAGTRGYLDAIPVGKVGEFERRALSELKTRDPGVLESIRTAREITPATEKSLVGFLDGFAKTFA